MDAFLLFFLVFSCKNREGKCAGKFAFLESRFYCKMQGFLDLLDYLDYSTAKFTKKKPEKMCNRTSVDDCNGCFFAIFPCIYVQKPRATWLHFWVPKSCKIGDLGHHGRSWGILEASWARLGPSLAILGRLGGLLGRLGGVLGRLGLILGASWGPSWASWGPKQPKKFCQDDP